MIVKEDNKITGYDITHMLLEVMIVRNIISAVLMLSLFGCALKAPNPIQPQIKEEVVPDTDSEKKTTLYSLFFGQDEEPEEVIQEPAPIVTQQPQVIVQKPRPVVKQPISAQPSPIVKEAPIHKAINKTKITPPKPTTQVISPKAAEEESSIFSFFSSKPAPVKVNLKQECIGDINLPISLQRKFDEVQDQALLVQAIGGPGQGKLCQGKVYQVKKNAQVNLFRTWNGNHLASQFGDWWTFTAPRGSVANYRQTNAICYQWTPIDKLSHCRLKAGSKIVVGTGQSVRCSDNLQYPISQTQQVYIVDAQNAVADCRDYDAGFSWKGEVNKR